MGQRDGASAESSGAEQTAGPSTEPQSPGARLLRGLLFVVLIGAVVGVVYVAIVQPTTADPYTEFYLLGPGGEASDYPTQLAAGESGTVVVGVTNHEGRATEYRVELVTDAGGTEPLATASRSVAPGETWETGVTFDIDEPGRHRVQVRLYRGEPSGEPYLTTRLWITVTSDGEASTAGPGTRVGPP